MPLSMPSTSSKGNKININFRLKMTMWKLLEAIVLLAYVLLPCCSASTERQIQVPALKRIASLGDLYNANIDHIINVGVFRRQIPTEHISETQNPTKRTDAGIWNLLENQFKLFNIDGNEAVNILTGITTARGAARILNHKKQSSQLRGTLTYKYQTVTTSLWAFHEGLTNTNLYNKDILKHIEATHVVASITWGATVAVTLEASSIETHDDIRKIQNSLNKELRNLRGKLLPSDEINSNFSMSITSDVPLPNEIPTTAKEEILNQVPTLIAGINQGKGIPLQYTLTPINMIRKHMGVNMQNITGHKINDFTLSEIIDAFQDLRSAEDRIHEIREKINGHPNCVSPQTAATINTIVSNFQTFKNNFTTTLKKSVVDVRLGLQENQVLSDLLEDFRNSEFSLENLNYKFLNLSSTIENIALCNTIQNKYSHIQYIGAGDDFISTLTTLQTSNTSVLVMFTNSKFTRIQPETYTESFNLLLRKQEEETYVGLLVNCDFSNSRLCNDLNDTVVFEYANGTLSLSFLKREIEENNRILELEATVVEIRKEMLNLQNFDIDQRQKQSEFQGYFKNAISILEHKLECVANPCLNSCKCTFKNNQRHCECSAGFSGDNCETNIDECAGHNSCLNRGTCVDAIGSFSCACAPGFTGNHCGTNIDDCAGHRRCLNGATCVDGTSSFSCACAPGFTGNHCGTNIDDCAGHRRCLNGATCVDGTSSFSCACAPGFTGNHCETNIDDCAGHHRCLNGGNCIDNVNSFSCACLRGFIGNHCEHITGCVYPGTCASASRDARCECREGYVQDPQNSRRCELVNKSLNENATLIFGSIKSIEQFSLKQGTVIQIQNQISTYRALDFLYRTNTVFWSGDHKMINTAPIRPGASKTVVLNDPGAYFLALAVDWVYDHLYFADDRRETINVANLDRSMKKVLFNTGVTETWAIVVDPLSGWIYWADFAARNIERAGMDGSRREVIESSPKNPLGLALDLTQNRLYWTTSYPHPCSIHSMNVDGSDKKLVFQATQPTFPNSQFRSITTFEDFVYWRDASTKAIYKTNKCGGSEATKIHSVADSSDSDRTLQAYHFSKQPEGVNYCANRIGGQCSYLCFPSPSNGNVSVTTKCACPDGRMLSCDLQTCT